jgi:hypothetical protein
MGTGRSGLRMLICIAGAVCFTLALQAQDGGPRFAVEREVRLTAAGPHRLPIDLPLLERGRPFEVVRRGDRAFAEGGLNDLRFFDANGQPVPHLLLSTPPEAPRPVPAAILAIAATEKTSGFEADLGATVDVDEVQIGGLPAPFLKRLRLEGSGDRERWTVLLREGTLFDLPNEGVRQTALSFQAGPYRYLRVTWDDTNSARVPLPRVVSARSVLTRTPPPPLLIDVPFERRASEPGRTRYRLRLPAARLPVTAIEIDPGSGDLYRNATVLESRFTGSEAVPNRLGGRRLVRVERDGARAEALRIPIASPTDPELDLVIEDEANPPLDLRRVSAVLAELPWIYLDAPSASLVAKYGNETLQRPTYDLEAARHGIDVSGVADGEWGSPRESIEPPGTHASSRESSPLQPGAEIDPAAFEYSRPVAQGQGLVAVPLDAAALAHSAGPSGAFSDVRIVDRDDRQVPYLIERRDEPLTADVVLEPVGADEQESGRSKYVVRTPFDRLPAETRLVLETSARVFTRNVVLGIERPHRRQRREDSVDAIDRREWQHADERSAAPALLLRIGSDAAALRLIVHEGDNAGLPITSARLLLPSYRLRFFHPSGTTLRLLYGRPGLPAPRYDLALLAPRVMGEPAREIGLGPEPPGGREAAFSRLSPTVFWALLGVSVVVLLGLIARLLKGAGDVA